MRKKIAILLFFVAFFNFCFASAEEAPAPWYPFGLDAADSYEEAAAKLEAALPEVHFTKRFSSMEGNPKELYLNDLPIGSIILMQPAGAKWAIIMMSGMIESTPGTVRAAYDFYDALTGYLGKPTKTSPMITKRGLDGSLNEISVYSSYEVFSETVSGMEKASYSVEFGPLNTFTVETYDNLPMLFVSMSFRNAAR